jgi:hypothetical protein
LSLSFGIGQISRSQDPKIISSAGNAIAGLVSQPCNSNRTTDQHSKHGHRVRLESQGVLSGAMKCTADIVTFADVVWTVFVVVKYRTGVTDAEQAASEILPIFR